MFLKDYGTIHTHTYKEWHGIRVPAFIRRALRYNIHIKLQHRLKIWTLLQTTIVTLFLYFQPGELE